MISLPVHHFFLHLCDEAWSLGQFSIFSLLCKKRKYSLIHKITIKPDSVYLGHIDHEREVPLGETQIEVLGIEMAHDHYDLGVGRLEVDHQEVDRQEPDRQEPGHREVEHQEVDRQEVDRQEVDCHETDQGNCAILGHDLDRGE